MRLVPLMQSEIEDNGLLLIPTHKKDEDTKSFFLCMKALDFEFQHRDPTCRFRREWCDTVDCANEKTKAFLKRLELNPDNESLLVPANLLINELKKAFLTCASMPALTL